MDTKEYLLKIGGQEKQFDALYRNTAVLFGLPDCAMWVLYYLTVTEGTITQQDLIEKMMFPKQTINSAVIGLEKKGLVELTMIPGTRNKKKIILTRSGSALVNNTVGRILKAECRAVERMGVEAMTAFIELHHRFYDCLRCEFQKDGLTDGTQE